MLRQYQEAQMRAMMGAQPQPYGHGLGAQGALGRHMRDHQIYLNQLNQEIYRNAIPVKNIPTQAWKPDPIKEDPNYRAAKDLINEVLSRHDNQEDEDHDPNVWTVWKKPVDGCPLLLCMSKENSMGKQLTDREALAVVAMLLNKGEALAARAFVNQHFEGEPGAARALANELIRTGRISKDDSTGA